MTTPECPRVTLVEALHDGRLGPQERASMERHLSSCAACSGLARDLVRIGDAVRAPIDPATPLEHQRARLALLRKAMDPAATAAPPAWFRGPRFVMAATALAAAVALGWIGAGVGSRPSTPEVALHLRPPPKLASARETTLRPSDDARFERSTSPGLDIVTLTSGTLDVTVRPLAPGQRFVVRTSDAEVEVRGTAFRVEAEGGKIRGVSVAEGAVEVRYAGFSAVIPSGGSWRATGDAPKVEPAGAKSAEPARAAPASAAPASAGPAAAPTAASASGPPSGKVASRAIDAAGRRDPKPAVEAQAPPVEEPAPTAAPKAAEPAPRPVPSASPASRAFADAMAALRRGDYAGSASKLDGFASSFPADARADEADYLRAIALQRAGRAAEAAAAAKRYLATRPQGAHRSEAKQIARE